MTKDLTTALETAFGAVKTDTLSVFEKAAPVALAIMGIGIAVTLGIKFFKKVSNKGA